MRTLKTFLLMIVAATMTNAAMAEDWPQFRGPRLDGISRETGLADKWPDAGPKQLWKVKVGLGYSSPIAVAGKIYIFTEVNGNETLACLDADSGKQLWAEAYQTVYPGDKPKSTKDFPGARATPVIVDTRIYTYGAAGELVCRNLADGKQIWRLNPLAQTNAVVVTWGQASCPLIADNVIYIQGGDGPIAYAIDAQTGKILWQAEPGLGGYTQPILVDNGGSKQLIVFAGKALYALDPKTGKTLWSEEWKTSWDVNAATPVCDGQNLFISSGYSHGSMLFKLDQGKAAKQWPKAKKEIACRFQGPILEGSVLYASSEGGKIRCMSWPDGAVKWTLADEDLRMDFGGAIVRVGDKLIAQGTHGMLGLIKATPDAGEKISQVQLFDESYDRVWSTPLVYNGKVYAKGKDELVCLDISKK